MLAATISCAIVYVFTWPCILQNNDQVEAILLNAITWSLQYVCVYGYFIQPVSVSEKKNTHSFPSLK